MTRLGFEKGAHLFVVPFTRTCEILLTVRCLAIDFFLVLVPSLFSKEDRTVLQIPVGEILV